MRRASRNSGVAQASRLRTTQPGGTPGPPRGVFALFPLLALSSSCWPGWDFLFDPTPSREHRVEDMRVLAVELEPASIVLSPAFLRDGGPPVSLTATPVLFDPRGGDIDVDVSLCVDDADPNPFNPCTFVSSIPARRRVVTTSSSTDDPLALGRETFTETFELTHDDILAMFDAAGVPPLQVGGITAGVVVNVGRTFDGRRERERAELLFSVEVDPFGEGTTPELFADSGAANCRGTPDEGGCTPTPDEGGEPECGNGVVEGPLEQCDPPTDDGRCSAECQAFDFCVAAPVPMCVEAVAANQRNVVDSLLVFDSASVFPGEDPETLRLEDGDVLPLEPGVPRFIAPVLPDIDAREQSQNVFSTGCPADSPGGASPFIECGVFGESFTFRVYVADARAELVSPGAIEGEFFGNPVFEGETVGVAFAADAPAGTREPLVVVVADGRGGMDVVSFVLEAQ